jgi:hypothetical protein
LSRSLVICGVRVLRMLLTAVVAAVPVTVDGSSPVIADETWFRTCCVRSDGQVTPERPDSTFSPR